MWKPWGMTDDGLILKTCNAIIWGLQMQRAQGSTGDQEAVQSVTGTTLLPPRFEMNEIKQLVEMSLRGLMALQDALVWDMWAQVSVRTCTHSLQNGRPAAPENTRHAYMLRLRFKLSRKANKKHEKKKKKTQAGRKSLTRAEPFSATLVLLLCESTSLTKCFISNIASSMHESNVSLGCLQWVS